MGDVKKTKGSPSNINFQCKLLKSKAPPCSGESRTGGRDALRGEFLGGRDARWGIWGFNGGGGAVMGGRRWDVEVKGVCGQPKSSMQPFGGPLGSSI